MKSKRSIRALVVSLALVVMLVAAPSAFAQGRPMRATFERTSCLDWTITATWWKKLTVRAVKVDLYAPGDNWLGAWAWGDEAGYSSPFTRSVEGTAGSESLTAVISIYDVADVFPIIGPPPTPLMSVTESATASCQF
jgi:hypothetical protein